MMTGRELIIYILSNNLEDEPVYLDGQLLGFMTDSEAAVKFGVARATVEIWVRMGHLKGIVIAGQLYIPSNAKNPIEGEENV